MDALLTGERLNFADGFADANVVTLDPAVGTGTYLLGVLDRAAARVIEAEGEGSVAERLNDMAAGRPADNVLPRLFGFEYMVGPYAVAQLRVAKALAARNAANAAPPAGSGVYLTDTLESPDHIPPAPQLFAQPIAVEHQRALGVKSNTRVLVCLGNPPYDRHDAPARAADHPGRWVVRGDAAPDDADAGIFRDLVRAAIDAGHGRDVKNLYNLYIYFWRWAIWKVFQHPLADGHPGIVCFITGNSYLTGDAFVGLREMLRRQCDEVYILDLGGDNRGTRPEPNVFAIQAPVAIAVAVRYGPADPQTPAVVRYHRVRGDREQKLNALAAINDLAVVPWEPVADGWQDAFEPIPTGEYFDWPLLTELFPWQHSGVQVKRKWPIAPDRATLVQRWERFASSPNKAVLLYETRDRKIHQSYPSHDSRDRLRPLLEVDNSVPCPPSVPYAYRSFDRQLLLNDNRLVDYIKPALWRSHGDRQIYIGTQLAKMLGEGPGLTACADVPDLDFFCNRGAREIIPLYRDTAATEPNVAPGWLAEYAAELGRPSLSAEDLLAYVYGVLAHSGFIRRFWDQLETRQVRVPLTRDAALFDEAVAVGRRLLFLHTYATRLRPLRHRGGVPRGAARCTHAVPGTPESYPEMQRYDADTQTLHVGEGTFVPVSPAVWAYSVSGYNVVESWIAQRLRAGAGRRSSPLDEIRPERWTADFTTQLLELLWVLEATLSEAAQQADLLARIVAGPLVDTRNWPAIPTSARRPPNMVADDGLFGNDPHEGDEE